jgi:ankyrin repeat protein
LEQQKEDLINNYKDTTNALLDKIKNLELQLNNNKNIIIERPQTAMIARDLQDKENNEINDENIKFQRCPNCQKEIPKNEFIIHSLSCLRHSYKCKKCGELINDEILNEHIKSWTKPEKIYKSIISNNLEEFIMIINHGIKNDCILDEKNGDYIYHLICRRDNLIFLNEIIKRKIKFNLDSLNKNKETPLITAINNQSFECAEIMIKSGANITLRNKGDLSPLMLACKYGYDKLVNILVERGADINEKNILGETPLSLAQINKHDDLALQIMQKSQLKF